MLTQNVPDPVPFATGNLECPAEIIVNRERKGFGANHNAAFAHCRTPFFCMANPDIRLPADPFPALVASLENERIGAAGPMAEVVHDARRGSRKDFALMRRHAASMLRFLLR